MRRTWSIIYRVYSPITWSAGRKLWMLVESETSGRALEVLQHVVSSSLPGSDVEVLEIECMDDTGTVATSQHIALTLAEHEATVLRSMPPPAAILKRPRRTVNSITPRPWHRKE